MRRTLTALVLVAMTTGAHAGTRAENFEKAADITVLCRFHQIALLDDLRVRPQDLAEIVFTVCEGSAFESFTAYIMRENPEKSRSEAEEISRVYLETQKKGTVLDIAALVLRVRGKAGYDIAHLRKFTRKWKAEQDEAKRAYGWDDNTKTRVATPGM